jgi:hypothetical protein
LPTWFRIPAAANPYVGSGVFSGGRMRLKGASSITKIEIDQAFPKYQPNHRIMTRMDTFPIPTSIWPWNMSTLSGLAGL